MSTRKRTARATPESPRNNKHVCQRTIASTKLSLDSIPANKQTLRRGTTQWPTRKEPPSEVDVLWYKDEGGLQNALSFCVRLVHCETGEPALGHQGMHVKAELLIDKSEVAVDPAKKSQLALVRQPGCRPVIGADGTCTLRLKITDVSKNHGNVPFRVRLGLAECDSVDFCPDIEPVYSELITVRSKRGAKGNSSAPKNMSPSGRPTVINAVNPQDAIGTEIGSLVDRLQQCPSMNPQQRTNLEQTTADVLQCTSVAFMELENMHRKLGEVLNVYRSGMQQHLHRLKETVDAVDSNVDEQGLFSKQLVKAASVKQEAAPSQFSLPMPTIGRTVSVGSNFSISNIDLEGWDAFSPRKDP